MVNFEKARGTSIQVKKTNPLKEHSVDIEKIDIAAPRLNYVLLHLSMKSKMNKTDVLKVYPSNKQKNNNLLQKSIICFLDLPLLLLIPPRESGKGLRG